ncbi:MAG: thermosome subunit, partial [Candidatus Hecatellales archaeon]
AVTDFIKTSLGPFGRDKLVVDKHGLLWATSNGFTIFRRIEVQHPMAGLLLGAALFTHKEMGDGAKSVIIYAGEILKHCESLLKLGLHPSILVEGVNEAIDKSLSILSELAENVNLEDKEILEKIVMQTFPAKFSEEERRHLAKLVVEAALKVAEKKNGRYYFDFKRVEVKKAPGGSILDSQLVEGLAFLKEIPNIHMPKRLENVKIAVLEDELRLKTRGRTRDQEHSLIIEGPEGLKIPKRVKTEILGEMVERLVRTGAKVILVEKGVDDLVLEHLARLGILVIRRFSTYEMENVALAVGARLVSIDFLSEQDLGEAKLVEERIIGERPWWFIEGCKNARCVTILVRGGLEQALNEAEQAVSDGLRVLSSLFKNPRVLPGGGAVEAELAVRLKKWSREFKGKEQLVIERFANALEAVPYLLAENAGMDSLSCLVELRSRHVKGEKRAGIEAFNRRIEDMFKAEVYEVLPIKEQIFHTVREFVTLILRVDGFIMGRKLTKPEYYRKKREKGMAPEKLREIKRDYGIDWV